MLAGSVIGGLVGFLIGLFIFIAIMSIWSNTGRTAKLMLELVRYARLDHGLDINGKQLPPAGAQGKTTS